MKTIVCKFTPAQALAMTSVAETTEQHLNAECGKLTPQSDTFATFAEMASRLHTALMDGAVEAIHSALCDCVTFIGDPIIEYWAKTFDKEDLEGRKSVSELIGKYTRKMQRMDAIRKIAAQTSTHLQAKDSYLRASGVDKIERAGIAEAIVGIDTVLADDESTIDTIGKAIEAALPFCSLWFKGLLLDKFFEVSKF